MTGSPKLRCGNSRARATVSDGLVRCLQWLSLNSGQCVRPIGKERFEVAASTEDGTPARSLKILSPLFHRLPDQHTSSIGRIESALSSLNSTSHRDLRIRRLPFAHSESLLTVHSLQHTSCTMRICNAQKKAAVVCQGGHDWAFCLTDSAENDIDGNREPRTGRLIDVDPKSIQDAASEPR